MAGAVKVRIRRVGAALMVGAGIVPVVFLLAVDPSSAALSTVERIAGEDRYETAAAISVATFEPEVPVVFIATGQNFPDALAGGPAAGVSGGPILLVEQDEVPPSTEVELERLAPAEIVVLGGEEVVSAEVFDVLEQLAPRATTRIARDDRYATAAAISEATFAPGVAMAYVATGTDFPDALPGGAAGANLGGPVLLVDGESVSDALFDELVRLEPAAVTVLGGSGIVLDELVEEIDQITGITATRVAGGTRYETATELSAATFVDGSSTVFVATGASFPDALAGGPAAGEGAAPLLLVPGECAPQSVIDEIDRLGAETMVILGGTAVVEPAIETLAVCIVEDGVTTTTVTSDDRDLERAPATPTPTEDCDPAYPDFCIPPAPPELTCADVDGVEFTVLAPDPHGFDADGNGIGCETTPAPLDPRNPA